MRPAMLFHSEKVARSAGLMGLSMQAGRKVDLVLLAAAAILDRKAQPQPVDEASNVVPFGEGGPVSGPYGTFNAGGAKGGFGFTGGGGDFRSESAASARR